MWKEERRRREVASDAEVWATLKKQGQAVRVVVFWY
jgi:hypothetical protein